MRDLLEHGADVNAIWAFGTPLHAAATEGHTETCALLMEHGANVAAKDSGGYTPLYWAALKGHAETADLLHRHRGGG